jgi:hypothetical protein
MPEGDFVHRSDEGVVVFVVILVELLEEKGVITQAEWEQRIKKNLNV